MRWFDSMCAKLASGAGSSGALRSKIHAQPKQFAGQTPNGDHGSPAIGSRRSTSGYGNDIMAGETMPYGMSIGRIERVHSR